MSYNILFTGTGRRVELIQAFREAALVLDKKIKIFGADMTNTAPALAFCDYVRLVPAIRDASYIPELLDICKKDKIDILIPTIDTDLLILAENKRSFDEIGTKVLVSEPEMISVCRDKNVTSRFFVDCGLNAPIPVNDWHDYTMGFPAFIKPKDGSSSINAFRVDSQEELETYAKQVPEYIIQPYIDGTEYTVDIFCDFKGNPISIVPRIRLQVRTGEVIKTKIALDATIIEECRSIIKRFKPCGPLTVQLIRDKYSGKDYYIEINPRFGGGSPLSMKAGARSAESILKILSGESISYCSKISDGAIYSRFDQTVCIENNKNEIRGVIFDLDDTLYSERDYVKSGYKAVSDYLGGGYEDVLWQFFEEEKPAIDEILHILNHKESKEALLNEYRFHEPTIFLYDDVVDTINYLKDHGIKIGIITDGRPEGQRNKIKALGLDKIVEDKNIIITDELGGDQFRKPCDIAFRIMQRRWRMPFEQILYVGDNPNKDFTAPTQLGITPILLCNNEGLYFENEDTINKNKNSLQSIGNISEIKRFIQ